MNGSQKYVFAISFGMAFAAVACATDIPRLGAIYYGQVLNAYGCPCATDDGVTLSAEKSGGVEAAHYDIGPVIGPGINYRLQLNVVAAGSGTDGTSVPEGGTVQLRATVGGQWTHLIGDTNLVVTSGAVNNRAYILGTDANNDGIPDEWEQFVIDAMAAIGMSVGVTNLVQFNPSADYDGDGVNNRQEFLAGTLPFLASDYLRIEQFSPASNGTCRIRFLGNQGFMYEVRTSSNLLDGAWQVTPVGKDSLSPKANGIVQGAGAMQDLYFPTNGLSQFFQLMVR